MTTSVTRVRDDGQETFEPPRQARRRVPVPRAVLWLAAAWLVPPATHLLRVDWLLPPLVLVATASLLRGGRTLLDRLVLAVSLLLGATCAAGLLFTVWPFGLEPVPVAGTAGTVLGAVSVLTGRTPRLPRPGFADALTLATAAAAVSYIALPIVRADATGRLAMQITGEDHARHLSLFDALRRIGGYAFWRTPAEMPDVWAGMRFYPPGWHLTAGLLDGFARSSTALGDMTGVTDHYVAFVVATYGLFVVAVLWAAQRIAGPAPGIWRLPLVAFLAVQLVYGEISVLLAKGFVSELLGLAVLVVLVAVLARRPGGLREQALVVGALLVAIGFSYELFLPPALLAVGVWAVGVWLRRDRPRVRRHLRFLIVTGVVAGAFAAVPIVIGMAFGGHAGLLPAPGGILRMSRAQLIMLATIVACLLLVPAVRRMPAWRSYLASLVSVGSLVAGLVAYRLLTGVRTPYYLEKTLHGVFVVLLIGLGGVVALVAVAAGRRVDRRRPSAVVRAALAAVVVVMASGTVVEDTPWRPGPAERLSRDWHAGSPIRVHGATAAAVAVLHRRVPARPGTATVVLTGEFLTSYLQTLYLTTVQRTSGVTQAVIYGNGAFSIEPAWLAETVAKAGTPMLFIVYPAADPLVEEVRRRAPQVRIDVVRPPQAP